MAPPSSDTSWCPLCKRDVQVSSRFSWVIFLGLCIFFIVPGVIYAWWALTRPRQCPICGCRKLYESEAAVKQRETGQGRNIERGQPSRLPTEWKLAIIILAIIFTIAGAAYLGGDAGSKWKVDPLTSRQVQMVWDTPLQQWQIDKLSQEQAECLQRLASTYGTGAPYMVQTCVNLREDDEFDMRRANWEETLDISPDQ